MHDQDCICCTQGVSAAKNRIEQLIQRHGHAVMSTVTECQGESVSMAYTIGLHDQAQPELLVFAMPPQLAHMLLNHAAELLKRGELSLDSPCTQLANLPVAFIAVSPADAADYIVQANNRAGRELPAWQMVWTDTKGNFPWNDDFEEQFKGKQPLLGRVSAQLMDKNV